MIRNNYHTHTFRCGHAIGNDEEYVLEAIALGLNTIGFSDHVMLEHIHQPNMRGEFDAKEGYFSSIRSLKDKYKDRINILLGFEAEPIKEYFSYYRDLKESGKVDYLIVGNHCTLENGIIRFFFSKCTEKKNLLEYKDTLIEGMKTGLFSYIAHPDYYMDSYYKWDATAKKVAKEIIHASIEYDIPLEFNLACFRRGKQNKGKEFRYGYPYLPFWKMVEKMKAKVIIGIDAHSPNDITTYLNDDGYKMALSMRLNLVDEIKI